MSVLGEDNYKTLGSRKNYSSKNFKALLAEVTGLTGKDLDRCFKFMESYYECTWDWSEWGYKQTDESLFDGIEDFIESTHKKIAKVVTFDGRQIGPVVKKSAPKPMAKAVVKQAAPKPMAKTTIKKAAPKPLVKKAPVGKISKISNLKSGM